MRQHQVVRGDTLSKIAFKYFADAALYKKLAEYNGIVKPYIIYIGQQIKIPSKAELQGKAKPAPAVKFAISPPHGLAEIKSTFGDIWQYISADGSLKPSWEAEHFGKVRLPFAIPLSWKPSLKVLNLYCHVKMKEAFKAVFTEIENKNLANKIETYGGCFNYRSKRYGSKLSTHCWGIAIDLNPETNRMGTSGNMDSRIVDIFKRHGFTWGGDWTGRSKDPMHFQFCSGY
jgi:LysM repeat protein